MTTQSSKKEIVDAHNSRTAIGNFNGRLDYPSSRGLGVDVIDYQRRNPHPTEKTPLPVQLKMRDLPHSIIRDLKDAHRAGELRGELHRHIELLEKNQYADAGTIKLLRGFEGDLTEHPGFDSGELDILCDAIGACGPTGSQP